jgi:uncharacterized membrane protein YqjE
MQPDASGVAPAAGTEGFLPHIRQLGASVLSHVAMRVELLSIEVQEEKARLARLAMSAALVSAMLIISLVMLAILVLAIYWDTPSRVTAAVTLAAGFALLTAAGAWYLSAQLKRSTTLFATSAEELRRDAAALAPVPASMSTPAGMPTQAGS